MSLASIIYSFLLLIIFGIGVGRYKNLNVAFKILTISVLSTFILNAIAQYCAVKYHNNAPILHLECLSEYVFYSATFYFIFKNPVVKKLILASIIIVLICWLINATVLQPISTVFPSNMYVPTQILYVIFSLLLFKEMLQYPVKVNITKQSVFWFNTAILFYSTTMFFNLGVTNYIAQHNIYDYIILYFWYFILYTFHILIGIAILNENRETVKTDA